MIRIPQLLWVATAKVLEDTRCFINRIEVEYAQRVKGTYWEQSLAREEVEIVKD